MWSGLQAPVPTTVRPVETSVRRKAAPVAAVVIGPLKVIRIVVSVATPAALMLGETVVA
jgi:hypothetical protein